MGNLEAWQGQINGQISKLERARLGDLEALKNAATQGEAKAKGLIVKPMYEVSPGWLQFVYGAGAQYYFQANGPFVQSLWDTEMDTPKYSPDQNYEIDAVLSNLREGQAGLSGLLTMLKDLLPDEWLNSPASLSDQDFFDR
jgi:hypothetical protein